MLSHMPNAHHDISSGDRSYASDNYPSVDQTLGIEDRLCPGCKSSVVSENGGLVVAFGYVTVSLGSGWNISFALSHDGWTG